MALRRPRARAARRLGDQRLAGDGRRRARPTRRFRAIAQRRAGRRAGDHGADAGVRRARHERAAARSCALPTLVIHGTDDQLLPVAERPADRLADPRRAARDPRRRRAPVLLGAPRALGRARARARRRARLSVTGAETAATRCGLGEPRRRLSARRRRRDAVGRAARGRGRRSCCCTASPRRAATS